MLLTLVCIHRPGKLGVSDYEFNKKQKRKLKAKMLIRSYIVYRQCVSFEK